MNTPPKSVVVRLMNEAAAQALRMQPIVRKLRKDAQSLQVKQ